MALLYGRAGRLATKKRRFLARAVVAGDPCHAAPKMAGLDEGLLQFFIYNLLYMENPYNYKKCQ